MALIHLLYNLYAMCPQLKSPAFHVYYVFKLSKIILLGEMYTTTIINFFPSSNIIWEAHKSPMDVWVTWSIPIYINGNSSCSNILSFEFSYAIDVM